MSEIKNKRFPAIVVVFGTLIMIVFVMSQQQQQIHGNGIEITDQNVVYNDDEYYPTTNILGKVENNGNRTISLVGVTIEMYDQGMNLIGLETTYTNPSTILPNQSSAFKFEIGDGDVDRALFDNYILKTDGRYQ